MKIDQITSDFIVLNNVSIRSSIIVSVSISEHRITSVAINKTGEWLAFGSSSLGQLLVWEWQSETYILKQQGHFFDMNTLCHAPDGQVVATGGDDGKVKLWNTSSGFCFVTFSDHTSPVTAVVFAPSGKVVLSASLDGTVRAYDLHRLGDLIFVYMYMYIHVYRVQYIHVQYACTVLCSCIDAI